MKKFLLLFLLGATFQAVFAQCPNITGYVVSGGGTVCPGSSGATVRLSGSQNGITYQLKLNGTNAGGTVSGTGSALTWSGLTSPGSYSISASDGSCTRSMGTVQVNVISSAPTQYTVGGGGPTCQGTTATITLSGSQLGVYYQLLWNDTNLGGLVPGTGNALSFGAHAGTGTYTVIVPACETLMTGSATVTINSVPKFQVTGGGSLCPGSSGVTVGLAFSQPGTSYQLKLNGSDVGGAVNGTNSPLSWNNLTSPGTYTVFATNTSTGCNTAMNGSASVTGTSSPPQQFVVNGGGSVCSGSSTTITLSGSQSGINYQLLRNGVNEGTQLAGNGNGLSWQVTSGGTYTIVIAGCGIQMSGSANVTVNFVFSQAMTGGGTVCMGSPDAVVGLSDTETGVSYQLKVNGGNTGVPLSGTGDAVNWANLSMPGTYTVFATNSSTGCTATMMGSVQITPKTATQFTVGGGGTICTGGSTNVTLSDSEIGIYYRLRKDGVDEGTLVAGTGDALSWTVSLPGTYSVSGCGSMMTGNAIVNVGTVTQYAVTGGGTICPGTSGLTIGLETSQQGIRYQLKRDGADTGLPLDGSGSVLTWNSLTTTGIYTVTGTNTVTGCSATMQGSAALTSPTIQPPLVAINGPSIINDDPITLSTNTGAGYTYQWKRDGDPIQGETHSILIKETGKYEVVISSSSECVSVSPAHFVFRKANPSYNGLISSVRWRTDKAHEAIGSEYQGMYVYHYDDKYQVKEATWAVPDFTLGTFSYPGNSFRVSDISYDRNGNILSLKRYSETGARQHNFAYEYNNNPSVPQQKNRLRKIPDYASYKYDTLGRLIAEDKVIGSDQYIEYDASGKVRKVFSDAAKQNTTVEYIYDDRGFRLAKKDFVSGKTTWYVRDATGNVLSVYESANGSAQAKLLEAPIYGSGKVGAYYPTQKADGYYQDSSTDYEITDHLGNVRALVRDNVNVYAASVEDSGQPVATNPRVKEMQHFINLFETEQTDVYMNHSPATTEVSSPNKSAYLFWQDGVPGIDDSDKLVGPGIMLEVKVGDKVNAEAWVRYERKASYARNIDLFMLSQFLGSNFAGMGGFEGYTVSQASSTFQSALTGANFMSDGTDEIRPFAYINYILFNENMTLADAGWKRIPENAGHTSGQEALSGMHQKVAFDESVEVDANGYIYVWVSNESENTKVWFDDLKVTHEESFVTQATDYGVWGDVIREQKSTVNLYRYGYQGQFAEKDTQTGWNHFELREYDPIIGRWLVPDRAGQYWSPYLAFGNNPVNRVDPDGGKDGDPKKCPECNNGGKMLREVEVEADKWSSFDEWLYQAYESWKNFKSGDGIAFYGNNDFFGYQPVFTGRKGRASHFITDPGGMLRPLGTFTWRKGPWPMGHIPSKAPMTVLEVFETAKDGFDAVEKIKNIGDPTIELLEKAFRESVETTTQKVQEEVHSGLSKAQQIQNIRDSLTESKQSPFRIQFEIQKDGSRRDTSGATFYTPDGNIKYYKLH